MSLRVNRFPLHVYLSILFVTLIIAFLGITIMVQDQGTRQMMLGAAQTQFGLVENETRQGIQSRYDSTLIITDLLATSPMTEAHTLPQRLERLGVIAQPLRDRDVVSAVYVGYANGDFILIRRLIRGSDLARSLNAPASAVYLVQSVTELAPGKRGGHYAFYNDALGRIEDRVMPDYTFDPRTRPWFANAMGADAVTVSAPYAFFTTGEAGLTVARRSLDGQAVAAVDVRLSSMSEQLDRMRPTRSSTLVVFNDKGEVVADADGNMPVPAKDGTLQLRTVAGLGRPVLDALFAMRPAAGSRMLRFEGKDDTWQGQVSTISLPGGLLFLAAAAPHSELLADAQRIRNRALEVVTALLVLAILCTYLVSHFAARSLAALTLEAKSIRALKFDAPGTVHSMIAEIDTLGVTMASMKSTIRRFLDIGVGLASERSFGRLLDRILTETIRIADARGGLIYLAESEGELRCELGRLGNDVVTAPPAIAALLARSDDSVAQAMREGTLSVAVSAAELERLFPGVPHMGRAAVLAVPLRNRQGALLGVLVLLQEPAALNDAAEQDVIALVEAISGTAAAALDAQRLLLEQKQLLQSFIELVAEAIDRKSPYTGGHCRRVPELTKMIAHAAEDATEGPFADFSLDETQWEELHIAAWLHDCGKVTSPEYVVDKATKLETIYDRLHEVRMRFEVLKREAEAACWRAIAEGAASEPERSELHHLWAQLDDEFAFVASCNEGGEYMAPEKVARLQQIARRQWTRTLDDRIGLSEEEKRRKAAVPPTPLPAQEPLLADRPEQIFPRREGDKLPPDNPWGFKVEVPQHLYNRGELYNLSIGRGTLTAEDRFKINEHMIETIKMLNRLPFPGHLGNVPEIAGGHHEKMDGTGYPRRLTREQMSVPARMMAIADIFEALTAVDRPYKRGKTISESLSIMAKMRDDRHIDPDLFDLFVGSGVYREFAARYMQPEQIDPIDPADYLARREQPAPVEA